MGTLHHILIALQLLSYYWLLSASYGLGQNVALRYPRVRRLFSIPVVPSESHQPIADMRHVATDKWRAFWDDVREKNQFKQ